MLVADDDPIILRLLEVNLVLEGFEVDTAVRGEAALRKAKEHVPDLVILDVMMPELSGWEVAERLRKARETADVPIVFLSARTQDSDRQKGEDLGVDAYVTKPFDPTELMQLVRKLASGGRNR